MEQDREIIGRRMRCFALILSVLVVMALLWWLARVGRMLFALLFPFFLAIIIAYILNPLVNFLDRRRLPRCLGILLIYIVFFRLPWW